MHPDSDPLPPPRRRLVRNPARASDPRTIVTPDAFTVHPELLGVPLAQHSRRIGAILLDLLLIALLTRAGGLLLGLLAGLFFFRMAVKRKKEEPPSAMRTAFRGTVGCFGSLILLITAVALWSSVRGGIERFSGSGTGQDTGPSSAQIEGMAGVSATLGALGEGLRLRNATTTEGARTATEGLARRLSAEGLDPDDIRELVDEVAPADAPWTDSVPGWIAGALSARAQEQAAPSPVPAAGPDTLPLPEALERYAAALREFEGSEELDADTLERLRARIGASVAADTLAALETRISRESAARSRAEAALADARDQAGVRAFLRRIADDLGLGIGWAALYFSVFLSWWNGSTPAKKFFRIRVVRLDRSPISWWIAFERFGGYAAGFATGLLGFAQVYWDPNRQAIHDRIAGTVVVQDGKPPVPGRWRHMAAPSPEPPRPVEEHAP